MSQREYEFRVLGRLSETTRRAFADMDVTEIPAETSYMSGANERT